MEKTETILTDNAYDILTKIKYFKNNEKTWSDMVDRISKGIGEAEVNEEDKIRTSEAISKAMLDLDFVFSSPCLLNSNKDNPGQLSSCFVLGVRDNIESISKVDGEMAKIFQRNGGAGLNISVLRPNKSRVENTNGYSCGVTGFMHKFNTTADIMTRNNPTKRGALKINLDVWHPDIFEFIESKKDITELQLMNISVSLYDEFISAVIEDGDWNLEFPEYSYNKERYNAEWDGDLYGWKMKGYPTTIYKTIKARDLMETIIHQMWKTGEPGVNYQDTMNIGNMNKHLARTVHTNPCNEFSNIEYSSCNLGSINLSNMVNDKGDFNYNKFESLTFNAILWLDNMITVNKLPLDEIHNITNLIRPIGLGTMGLADALYKMKIKYNSDKAVIFIDELYRRMRLIAIKASSYLANLKGVYPAWEGSEWQKISLKMRNSNLLSIAPNGTISVIANCSSSIEPNFALVYNRRTNAGDMYLFVNEIFKEELVQRGIYSDELINKIFKNNGSCQNIDEIPDDLKEIFVTAQDMTPDEHLTIVATIQKYIDMSISKTVNIPNTATIKDIEDVILSGWNLKLKGLTVYRDGSRTEQTLSTGNSYSTKEEKIETYVEDEKPESDDDKIKRGICPLCGNKLQHVAGCISCSCGWSKC